MKTYKADVVKNGKVIGSVQGKFSENNMKYVERGLLEYAITTYHTEAMLKSGKDIDVKNVRKII
jgi:hypothetical protein